MLIKIPWFIGHARAFFSRNDLNNTFGGEDMTTNTNIRCVTWFDYVYQALWNLGGKAHLNKIYNRVRKMRREDGRSLPKNLESIVRTTLEDRCKDAYFRTGKDIFRMPEGK